MSRGPDHRSAGQVPERGLHLYWQLMRLDRPIGTWLLFLPGLWGILLARSVTPVRIRSLVLLVVLFAIGSVVMRSAGCVVNDIWDRRLDRLVARTAARPLASGALDVPRALVLLTILLGLGLVVLLQLNDAAQRWGAASLVLVAVYPAAKRVTWYPQLVLGFTFGYGAWLGWIATTGRPGIAGLSLYAAAIAWDLGFDTIYGFQDIEDDALVGIRSTSRRFVASARAFLSGCYSMTLLFLCLAGWFGGMSLGFWLTLPLPALLLARQIIRLDNRDPARCLSLFKSNREAGLAIALCLLLGLV